MQLSQDHSEKQDLSQITRNTFSSLFPTSQTHPLLLHPPKQEAVQWGATCPLNLCNNPSNRYSRSHCGPPPDSGVRGEYLLRSHSREGKAPPTRSAPNQAMSSPPKVTYALSKGSQVLESHFLCFTHTHTIVQGPVTSREHLRPECIEKANGVLEVMHRTYKVKIQTVLCKVFPI